MEADKYYHVYNRTNNNEDLFKEDRNYVYFLHQIKKYIHPIAEIFCYCLLRNHFHFVLKIRSEPELNQFFVNKKSKRSKPLNKLISLQFGHCFNSYTQAINKAYGRNGSLFTPNFKRKEISSAKYLRNIIIYVHLNPLLHGFEKKFEDYPHSSYAQILSEEDDLVESKQLIDFFDDLSNFEYAHQARKVNHELLSDIISDDP